MQLKISQGSQDWLDLRRSKITATDASVVMEASPWKTPYQLWLNKIGEIPDSPQTEQMRYGLEMEDEARKFFENMTGLEMHPQVVVSDQIPWMMASLDGITSDGKDIVEIKCPGREDHHAAIEGLVPVKYYPQVQHQISVCELDRAFYFSYQIGCGVCVEVKRDDSYIKRMIELEKEFYDCLIDFVAPKLIERDFFLREDEEWHYYSSLWKKSTESIKKLELVQEESRKRLIEMANGHNTKGSGVTVSKYLRKGSIVYQDIPELETVDLNKYRKDPLEVWRISE